MGKLTASQTGLKEVLSELEKLEGEIASSGVESPDPAFRERFKGLFNSLHAVALGFPPLKEGIPNWLLKEAWGYGIRAITNFWERKAKTVGIGSWGLAAPAGFPLGVSGTVTVNFRI